MRAFFSALETFENHRSRDGLVRLVQAPGVDGLRVEFEVGGERAAVHLDLPEARRFLDAVAALSQTSAPVYPGPRREVFIDAVAGNTLAVAHTNWGEPYEEGALFEFGGGSHLHVDLPARDLAPMRNAIERAVARMEASANAMPAMAR